MYCPKKLAMSIENNPHKRPKEILKDLRKNISLPSDALEELDSSQENLEDFALQDTQKQILQRLSHLKYKKNMKDEIICVDDLSKFVNDNKFEASNPSEVFVCDAMLSHKEGDPICIVFSSKTCLSQLVHVLFKINIGD